MNTEDADDGVAVSQEVIDASFELGSSSLDLGSYDQNAKQDNAKVLRSTALPEDVRRRQRDLSDDNAMLGCTANVLSLLEAAIHAILHIRQVYPEELFLRRKKFGKLAFQCVNTAVSEYVSDALQAIGDEIIEEEVERLIINIHQSEEIVESFIFVFAYNRGQGPRRAGDGIEGRQLQAMLRKLNAMDALLEPLPVCDQLAFSVIMITRDRSDTVASFVSPEQRGGITQVPASLIHICTFPPFEVSLYVQQRSAQEALDQAGSLEL